MPPTLLVTGFAPFGGESSNPSWDVARAIDGETISGLRVKSIRLPVDCARAALKTDATIAEYRPHAVLGLGQARGRPALSLERIAINLYENRNGGKLDSRHAGQPVVPGGPDGYFSRLPLGQILRALQKHKIPASISLSTGSYACNAVMYAALHSLRRRLHIPAGFIHLPFSVSQAARSPASPSMSLDLMQSAIRIAIAAIAERAL